MSIMAVRKIRNNWYVDFRHERKHIRKKSPENTRKGALAYESLLRSRATRGKAIFPEEKQKKKQLAYSEFYESWYRDYVKPNNSLSEQKTKKSIYDKHLRPFFGKMPIDEISARDVERFKKEVLEKGLKPKTLNNLLTVLSKSLKTAFEWELISSMPPIRLVKVPQQERRHLTQNEVDKLINATGDSMERAMVLTALRTGMRLGELCALEWKDIDWFNRHIVVQRSYVRKQVKSTKSNKIRYIPMTSDLYDCLSNLGKKHNAIFYSRDGGYMQKWKAQEVLERQCERAGVERATWHILRHTFASLLAQYGESMFSIQRLMGHSTIMMTERYAHFGTGRLHSVVEVLAIGKQNTQDKSLGHYVGNRL